MALACISLGSNLGHSHKIVTDAIQQIGLLPETSIEHVSSLYLTAPWGIDKQPDFINAVVGIQTKLDAVGLLKQLQYLENQFGRIRQARWRERTLDLDIICYANLQMNNNFLVLPHPLFNQRDFVLVPMAECYPDLVIAGKPVTEWLEACLLSQGDRALPEKIRHAL